ncbi:uncharacterized protein LOC117650478 [Thrips palmi]|uniref:Uncharacterized protein LOC117650478 n=1 Tax=Thrips palmi TaxID=161013 RepID=A0A6P8ZWQ9_THRPL|nr:uncharacterized protein LOC117650478 [Thrips palmi]
MAVDLDSSQPTQTDILKAAVNIFHCSVFCHGPYFISPKWPICRPVEVDCIWPESELGNYGGKCIYICDTAAFERLQTALKRVVIYGRGLAWPHVNLSSKCPAVEWLMFHNDSVVSPLQSTVPLPKIWFVISQDFQGIVDYVASVHSLVPSRSAVTIRCRFGVAMTNDDNSLHATQANASLTSIVMHPGDIITSLIPSYYPGNCAKYPFFPNSSSIYTMCVADRYSVKNCINNIIPPLIDTQMKNHISFYEVPQFLKSMIDDVLRVKNTNTEGIVPLCDDIIIKDEPLINEMKLSEKDAMSVSRKSSLSLCMAHNYASQKLPKKGSTLSSNNNFGRLLQCPKCPAAFKFGPSGRGLHLLKSHVLDRHKKFKDHCLLVIQRKYEAMPETSLAGNRNVQP